MKKNVSKKIDDLTNKLLGKSGPKVNGPITVTTKVNDKVVKTETVNLKPGQTLSDLAKKPEADAKAEADAKLAEEKAAQEAKVAEAKAAEEAANAPAEDKTVVENVAETLGEAAAAVEGAVDSVKEAVYKFHHKIQQKTRKDSSWNCN